ncbi:MAG TPA: glycosyltransferase [Acidobacteriota bacterium]|nr:glycosyltransferase [Acidobacteriota bacterium]
MSNQPVGDPSKGQRIEVTVVVPAHNEEGNIVPLFEQFNELVNRARFSLEVVLVDDGSTDQTLPRAVEAQRKHRFVRIVSLPYRRGLTEALRAGFAVARGDILVFYPADRQFHPSDIPRMVEKVRSGFDLVTGRKIGQYSKRIISGFYNKLSRILFRSIQVADLNSVKAFRRELIDVFDYRHDWHRFWVAIVSEAGYRVGEVDVTLYDRPVGRSKFGIWRIPGAILDLLAVKFQYHTMRRPLWYFGLSGMVMLALGFLIGLFALYQRFVMGTGNRSLIFLVMTLGLSGVILFAIGFLAESVAGIRQQVESMRSSPKYQVYRPGPPVRPPTDRTTRRPNRERSSDERADRGRRTGPSSRTRRPPRTGDRRATRTPDDIPTDRPRVEARPLKVPEDDVEKAGAKPDERTQEFLSFAFPASGETTDRDDTPSEDQSTPPEESTPAERTPVPDTDTSGSDTVSDEAADDRPVPDTEKEPPAPPVRNDRYGRRGRR